MKIAQLTLNGYYNYGNIFQKYALHKTLKKFADSTEVLWFNKNNFSLETGEIKFPMKKPPNNFELQRYFGYESARTIKFKEFYERHIKTRYDLPYIEEIADDYDFFVIGSDQVWGPNNWMPLNLKFLQFVTRKKKIAYAASIANPEIPDEYKNFFRQGIGSFYYVSVREEGAVKLIEDLGLKTPELVLDPVMLLTQDEWKKISRPPSWFNEKYQHGYIFTYYLRREPPPEIKSVAKELNLPVINLLDFNNLNHYTIGPEEFIFLIINASLVYTNSFHGVAFSILFRRPFINREYDDEQTKNMSMRIPGFLKMFGLENRIATSKNNYRIESPLEIDFSVRDKVLPYEKAKSIRFLTNALSSSIPEINLNGGGQIVNLINCVKYSPAQFSVAA